MYIIKQIKRNFQNFMFLELNEGTPVIENTEVSKPKEQSNIFTAEDINKERCKAAKNPSKVNYLQNLEWMPDWKKEKEAIFKFLHPKEWVKEWNEKDSNKVKNEIVDKILEDTYGKFYKQSIENGQTKEELRENYLKDNEKKLNEVVANVYDKEWNKIEIKQYDKILEENKWLASLNTEKNPNFTKELLKTYWVDWLKQYDEYLKSWIKLPENLKEFNEFKEKIDKQKIEEHIIWDKKAAWDIEMDIPKEFIDKEYKKLLKEPNWIKNLYDKTPSTKNQFEAGNTESDIWALVDVIGKLPDGKAKGILSTALRWAQKSEALGKGKIEGNPELDEFLWVDSVSTPWCKAFTNAVLSENWVAHTAWNYSRSALSQSNKIDQNNWKEFQPGDLVIVERKWSASDWAPGGHIWIFVWMSAKWHPIIVWWNQSDSITVKEETRGILWIRRVVSNEESKRNKEAINWEKETKV